MLQNFFFNFGLVVTVEIAHKSDTGYPTLGGYVTFSTAEEASKFLLSSPHVVDGKEISGITLHELEAPESPALEEIRKSC
uniref:RRM domain-containing protein n=1 Tax=Ditylenchus dipsaci TaxID=166011 RepID=A0A915CXE3_9BILA